MRRDINEILLVEGDKSVQELKNVELQHAGFNNIIQAPSAEEALEILSSGTCNPDTIIADICSSLEFGGFDLIHTLRGRYQWEVFHTDMNSINNFRPRIEIAEKYERLRQKFGRTEIILTGEGPLPSANAKSNGSKTERLERENYIGPALALIRKFIRIGVKRRDGEAKNLTGMDQLIRYFRGTDVV